MSSDSGRTKRGRAIRLTLNVHKVGKRKGLMILFLSLFLSASLLPTIFSSAASTTAAAQVPPITYLRTVQVTPDSQFLTGSFARINYVPATDRFAVSFGTKASTDPNVTLGAGYAYKEYNLDMQEVGKTGILEWYPNSSEAGDSNSFMCNSTYYCAFVPMNGVEPYGWRIIKYDAANWSRLEEIYVTLPVPNEGHTDPMVAYVNGQLDVSGQYNPSGIWQEGNSTRHHFFTADLVPLGNRTLDDSPNTCGSSILFVDGIYYYVSADSHIGGLNLLRYDSNWNFLGNKSLIPQAHWSQGMVFDGARFYVSYMDTSKRNGSYFFPVYPNVHLAVFDRDWTLVYVANITNFAYLGDKIGGRPWVILRGNLLYVSYDVDTMNTTTHEEEKVWQAYVSIFEIAQVTQAETTPWLVLTAGIVIVAALGVAYGLLKRR